jgi:hypothetical protein
LNQSWRRKTGRAMKEQEPKCRKLGSIVVPMLQGNETARSLRCLRGSIPSLAPQVKVGAPYFAPANRGSGRVTHATLPNRSSGVHVRRPTVGTRNSGIVQNSGIMMRLSIRRWGEFGRAYVRWPIAIRRTWLASKEGPQMCKQTSKLELPIVQSPSAQPGLHLERQLQVPEAVPAGRRYYFHVRNGEIYSDNEGTCFSSNEEAIAYGSRVAHELSDEVGWRGYSIAVTDDSGGEIARLPVRR